MEPEKQDVSPTPSPEDAAVVPLPPAGISKILGLLEIVDDHGGKEDIYKLARELRDSFGELIIIIKGAEVLGLVDTPGGDVVLQPLGKRVIETPVNEKKRLIAERIAGLPLFAHFRRYLAGREDHAASRSEVLEEIVRILPTERPKPQYDTLVNWGRYAEIFTYSRDEDKLRLAEPLA